MTRPLIARADEATCMMGRCPRAMDCWRYRKPAAARQLYQDFAGGDDCAHYIGIAHDAE